jgi:hypothetical protein
LSEYALEIGFALVALALGLTGWGLFLGRPRSRREDELSIAYSDLEQALDELRSEFQQSIEASLSSTTGIGEKVLAAVKPIEAALRDFSSRIANLEIRANASDQMSAGLQSSLQAQESTLKQLARTVETMNSRLEIFQQELTAVSGRLSTLRQMIEGITARNDNHDEKLSTVEISLGAVQGQMADLLPRVSLGETEFTKLSSKTESMVASVTVLESSTRQTDRRVSDLERHFASKLGKPEELLPGAPIGGDSIPTESVTDTSADAEARSGSSGVEAIGAPFSNENREPVHTKRDGTSVIVETQGGIRPAPVDRGGHPRGECETAAQPAQPANGAVRPRLQFVAIQGAGDWEIFAEVDPADFHGLRILQGGEALERPAQQSFFGPLRDLTTPIQIFSDNVEVGEMTLVTQDSPILYFRLQKDLGRSVRRPSRGLNMAIVPAQWRYDYAKSGAPPCEPESTCMPGYRVHFFSIDRNPILAFDRVGGESFEIDWAKPQFQLVGDSLLDDDSDMGQLLVGDLPVLEGSREAMAKVRTVVVGAEGRGSGRWRQEYKIDTERWQLPEDLKCQGSGWYFIRLYDGGDDIIDSFSFRYIGGLKSIDVKGAGVTQGTNEVRITFAHDEDVLVSIADPDVSPVEIFETRESKSTVFAWLSDFRVRKTAFEVCHNGRPVRVTLDTDRIWWALSDASDSSTPIWQLSPIQLAPSHFAPTAEAKLVVRFPRLTAVDASIGFTHANRRTIQIVSGRTSIYLHEFSEAPELRRFTGQTLKLWVCECDSELELEVAKVDISLKCPWCEARMDDQEILDHLLSEHHDQCFEPLKLQGEEVVAPNAIFVCLVSGCGQYYPDSPLSEENPISLLSRHSNGRHPNMMSFKKISSRQDIHNLMGLKEKWVWKCNLGTCRPITPTSDSDMSTLEKTAHLREEHMSDLFAGTLRAEH